MKFLNVAFAICIWFAGVDSQSKYPLPNQYRNPEQIYFRDEEVPNIPPSFHTNSGNTNQQQDSYLQGLSSVANLNPYTQSIKAAGLSLELQPPNYESKSDPNYKEAFNRFNESHKKDQKDSPILPANNVSIAISNFGLTMLKNINQQSTNVVISPFSVVILLSLLQQGAFGKTQEQISIALQMLPEASGDAFKQIIEEIQKRTSRNIFRVGNNAYVADAFDLSPAFKRTAMRNFGSEVTPMRFSKPQEAAMNINRWVAARTNNKIQQLLTADALSENTQLVLVNVIYFKGIWQTKFKPESTLPREFYLNQKQSKTVPFMRMLGHFKSDFDISNNAQFIILPFENNQYSLMILLPSEQSSLNSLISTLTAFKLAAYHNAVKIEVYMEIPKFTVRGDTDLTPVLKNMGITNVFSQQSELSGVGTYRTYSPQVSEALHTAMLAIDEEGASAAAATAFAGVALSSADTPTFFTANRPFLTVLWDNQLALPLFMARIENPIL